MTYDADELISMARAAERDDRLATGKLYGDLANALEQEIKNWKARNRAACDAHKLLEKAKAFIVAEHLAPAIQPFEKEARAAYRQQVVGEIERTLMD